MDLVVPVQAPHSLGLHAEALLLHPGEHLPEVLDASGPLGLGRDQIVPHQSDDFVACHLVPGLQYPTPAAHQHDNSLVLMLDLPQGGHYKLYSCWSAVWLLSRGLAPDRQLQVVI